MRWGCVPKLIFTDLNLRLVFSDGEAKENISYLVEGGCWMTLVIDDYTA